MIISNINEYLIFYILYTMYIHLVHPHLPECKAHPLLHIRPQLILLLQHVAGQQGRRWHRVVLLKIMLPKIIQQNNAQVLVKSCIVFQKVFNF